MTIPQLKCDMDELDKMINNFIEAATYRRIAEANEQRALRGAPSLRIMPDDARLLAGLLQELRQRRDELDSAHRDGYQQGINDAAELANSMPVDGDTIKEQLSVGNQPEKRV